MLLKKHGFPEEGELVLSTVSAVHSNSVFANLDEYGKSGLIHISEVSPGRIRNIRDFVVEGKKIVCLVLRVDKDKGHIDLSLRRVNENQKRNKVNEVKQEQKAEKILEYVAKKLDIGLTLFYKQIYDKISDNYSSLHAFFENIVSEEANIDELGLDKEKANVLKEIILDRIKPPEVHISADLRLKTYAPNGVELIKDILAKAIVPDVVVKYEGGGKFKVNIKSDDYKTAEKMLESFGDTVRKSMEKIGGDVSLTKR
ncbi:MAG: S1 RNA-binding domain-containing protein [Nanoarchaeota archaeon]